MKKFVFWTGMISILAGFALQWPSLAPVLMPSAEPGMLLHLFGAMAMFLGTMLIVCSRDLRNRGSLVVWEGVLRLGGFGVMAGYGLLGGGGPSVVAAGVFDLAVGLAYLVGIPRTVGIALSALLLDQRR